jgi:hypothetical protein
MTDFWNETWEEENKIIFINKKLREEQKLVEESDIKLLFEIFNDENKTNFIKKKSDSQKNIQK